MPTTEDKILVSRSYKIDDVDHADNPNGIRVGYDEAMGMLTIARAKEESILIMPVRELGFLAETLTALHARIVQEQEDAKPKAQDGVTP